MQEVYPEHIAERRLPINIENDDLQLFENVLFTRINATTVEKVYNVDILKDTVFDRKKCRFLSNYTHLSDYSFSKKIKRLKFFFKPFDKIEKGVWITDNWSLNYFHWLTDALPRLIASEPFLSGHAVILPEEYASYHYIESSLTLLNFRVQYFSPKKRLHIKELVLPSHTAPTGNYNKVFIKQVRDRFYPQLKIARGRKIYISRKKAAKRRIINENDLLPLLMKFGFEIHFLEDYSFSEQINLMQDATHLIGLHGAGLTNMLFLPKNAKVLELRNAGDVHNNCFFSLASEIGHPYYYLVCKGSATDTFAADVSVPINELEIVLSRMLDIY